MVVCARVTVRTTRLTQTLCKTDLHHEDHADRPAVPSVASSLALRSAFAARWSVHAGIDWYALRTSFAFEHG